MPKPTTAAAGSVRSRPRGQKKKGRAKKPKSKPPSRKRQKKAKKKRKATAHTSRAAILPSQSVDHGTPPVVAEGIIYPVLGDPVDLDPCSNADSIIRARRKVMKPDDGLAIPWRGRVFVNPPYGDKLIRPFIEKIVVEHRHHGAEIIALIPANVSTEWFDLVAATARCAFFWGPGDGGRRLRFIGNEMNATFASCVAYWGPNMGLFVRHAIRYCHPWYPGYDLSLTRAFLADAVGATDPLPVGIADELLALNRHDDLAAALVALGGTTLGEIMDHGRSALLHRLRALPAYELASALVCATRPGTHWLERRLPRTPKPVHQGQLAFPHPEPARQPDESVEDALLRHIVAAGLDGLSAAALADRLALPKAKVASALRGLRAREIVRMKGKSRKATYVSNQGEEESAARKPP